MTELALLKRLPPAIREVIEAIVGCIAGAAGLSDIQLQSKSD
jgi:hypothetical protein